MILYGASGHAKVILGICELNKIKVKAILDDNELIEKLNGNKVETPEVWQESAEPFIIQLDNDSIDLNIDFRLI